MIPRPHYAQPGCVYYICLLRDDLLLRQGVCWLRGLLGFPSDVQGSLALPCQKHFHFSQVEAALSVMLGVIDSKSSHRLLMKKC